MDKRQLRKAIILKRADLAPQSRTKAEQLIGKQLFDMQCFKNSHHVSSFVSFRDEIEMQAINEMILKEGKVLVLPYIDMAVKKMTFHVVKSLDSLIKNTYGILEPNPELHPQINFKDIDLVLAPGVAFDQKGFRLGYGGGFYDRFFSQIEKTIPKIGIAFELQVVESLEVESYDQPITHLLTETGLRTFNH